MSGLEDQNGWWVLAIDPTARGFAFAVLAGQKTLLDWGTRETQTDGAYAAAIGALCDQYRPHILALESTLKTRRGARAQARIELALSEAAARTTPTAKVSRGQIREALGAQTKDELARVVAHRFPELEDLLPRTRGVGDSEDERMDVFDAISFALTVLEQL